MLHIEITEEHQSRDSNREEDDRIHPERRKEVLQKLHMFNEEPIADKVEVNKADKEADETPAAPEVGIQSYKVLH